jgi:enamine deaminase RidA (YjgF/YER057c/UK114 family)
MKTTIEHLNPDELIKNRAYTQAVAVRGPNHLVFVGGQNAVNAKGEIVGKDDIAAQTEQVLFNLEAALAAAGAKLEDVVKWNVYVVQGHSPQPGFQVFQRVWGMRPNPPTLTVIMVAGLARPEFLTEIDAIAVVPETDHR